MLRVSIVIPVYNEAAYLDACLRAIVRQTVQPYEVIIVDNNSTDDTMVIARRYAEKHTYIRMFEEPRQGVVFARDRGFDAARGDIIGRIDADSVIRRNWVATVQGSFVDPSVGAVAGTIRYYDMGLSPLVNMIDIATRCYFSLVLGRHVFLQGSNMAMRRVVWLDISRSVCHKSGIHEDFDMAIHAANRGHAVRFRPRLVAGIAARQADAPFVEYCKYLLQAPGTYAAHGLLFSVFFAPVILLGILHYVPIKLLHKSIDINTGRFSLSRLLSQDTTARTNPALIGE